MVKNDAAPPSMEPLRRVRLNATSATVLVAVLSLAGTGIGGALGYLSTRDKQSKEYGAQLRQIVSNAETRLLQIETEASTQTQLQREKLQHEQQMAERKLASDIILATLGNGTVDEQITNLKAYSKAGLLGDLIGARLLDLPDNELPAVTPLRTGDSIKFRFGASAPRDDFDFTVQNHWLHDKGGEAPGLASPNVGGALEDAQRKFIVVDMTGGSSISGAVVWLTKSAARGSAHILIGRNGEIAQLAPFNRVAWHAGASEWRGYRGLNAFSLGIELSNLGKLRRRSNGQWTSSFGQPVPEADVRMASGEGWHAYSEVQVRTLEAVLSALLKAYPGIEEVVRQSEISPGRKLGPGPLLDVAVISKEAWRLARGR